MFHSIPLLYFQQHLPFEADGYKCEYTCKYDDRLKIPNGCTPNIIQHIHFRISRQFEKLEDTKKQEYYIVTL
jgi:hypothetical protein